MSTIAVLTQNESGANSLVDINANFAALNATKVEQTRTVNGHALSADVVVTASDLGVASSDTQTLTNKRIPPRVLVVTQSATPAINLASADIYQITGLAQAITSMTSGLTGSLNDGEMRMIQITDDGTPRAITWGATFTSTSNGVLPSTTVTSTMIRVLVAWNATTSKLDCIGVT